MFFPIILYLRLVMRTRLFCFLALLAYLNTLFHEDGHVHGQQSAQIIDGAPLIEIILEDVLNIPCQTEDQATNDFQYDDYRPASTKWLSIVPPKGKTTFAPLLGMDIFRYTARITLNTKISCLLGYYTFLFRFKPF